MKPSMASRDFRSSLVPLVLGTLVATLSSGCAIGAIATIVGRITSAKSASQLAPSWPTDDTVELVDQSIAFGDPKIQGSLASAFGGKGLLATSSTGVATISPPPMTLPLTSLGSHLQVATPYNLAVPAKTIGIPESSSSIPATSITFAQTPAGNATYNFPGVGTVPLSQACTLASQPAYAGLTLGTPVDMSSSTSTSEAIPNVEDVTVASGSLVVPVNNNTAAVISSLVITVTDANNNTVASLPAGAANGTIQPRTSATYSFDLTGKTIASPVTISVSITAAMPGSTPLSQIHPSTDGFTVGATTLAIQPQSGHVHMPAQQGTNPLLSSYNPALAPIVQTFPVTSRIATASGITAVDSVSVGSGSLTITLNNGLAVAGNFDLAFNGITNVNSAILTSSPGAPTITANAGVLSLPIAASTTSVITVPLSGATITPDATGDVTATLTPTTQDSSPSATTNGYAYVTSSDSLGGSVTLSPMTFSSVVGSFNVTEPIASQTVPLDLPTEITQTGIAPGAIAISLDLANQSELSGVLDPQIVGIASSGVQVPLVLNATASPPQTVFSGAFAGATTAGATQSTTIRIDQTNSNILQLLAAGVSQLQIGGAATITASHASINSTDQIGGQVSIAIPLSLVVPAFGPNQAEPAYDVNPPTPVTLSAQTASQLQNLQSAELDFRVDNGWHFPLTVNVLLSTTSDPYTDSGAIVRTLSLGSGPTTLSSLVLDSQQIAMLPQLKTIGFQITSPGTGGQAISILSTDAIAFQITAHVKAQLSTGLLSKI